MQRRQFIVSGVGVMAYAGAGMAGAAVAAAGGIAGQMSAAGFSAMLHQPFNVYDTKRGVTVELVRVRQAPGQGAGQFSLSFAGREGEVLDSGVYEVEHPATGKVMMYLDADKKGSKGVIYRADFNLLA